MLTLQSVIVIAVGWSAIYWQWTDKRLAVIIGFVLAYLITVGLVVLAELVQRRRTPANPTEWG